MNFFKKQDLELILAYQTKVKTLGYLSEFTDYNNVTNLAPKLSLHLQTQISDFLDNELQKGKLDRFSEDSYRIWEKFPELFSDKIPVVEGTLLFLSSIKGIPNSDSISTGMLKKIFYSYPDNEDAIIQQITDFPIDTNHNFHLTLLSAYSEKYRNVEKGAKTPEWLKTLTSKIKKYHFDTSGYGKPLNFKQINHKILNYLLKLENDSGNEVIKDLYYSSGESIKFMSWINENRPEITNHRKGIIRKTIEQETIIIKKTFEYDLKMEIIEIMKIGICEKLNSHNILHSIKEHFTTYKNFLNEPGNEHFKKIKTNNQNYSTNNDGILLYGMEFILPIEDIEITKKLNEALSKFDDEIAYTLEQYMDALKIPNIVTKFKQLSNDNNLLTEILSFKQIYDKKENIANHLNGLPPIEDNMQVHKSPQTFKM